MEIEAGRREPHWSELLALAEVLGADLGELLSATAVHPGRSPGTLIAEIEDDDVKRRQFLRQAMTAAAGAGFIPLANSLDPEPWQRLEQVLSHRSAVDATTVAHLADVTTSLESLQYEKAPGALVGSVSGHLDQLVNLLRAGGLDSRARGELLSLAGETSATLAWLRWDLGSPDAGTYWNVGRRAALEAGDAPLAAFIAASSSWLPEHRDNPPVRVEILTSSQRDATPRTLVWNLMAQAECHALEGQERQTLSLLDRADSIMAGLGDDRSTRRPRCDTWDATRSLGERGAVLVRLAAHPGGRSRRRGREAQALLAGAVREMDAQPHMRRMAHSLRVSLARAYAQQGEPDGAVEAAMQALDGALAMGIKTIPARLGAPGKLLDELRPWAEHPPVQQFDERLRACL